MEDVTNGGVCSICFDNYEGWGNNAEPINDGRCCDRCNSIVIMARIRHLSREGGRKGGQATTPAKQDASKANGKKGGRPKKPH